MERDLQRKRAAGWEREVMHRCRHTALGGGDLCSVNVDIGCEAGSFEGERGVGPVSSGDVDGALVPEGAEGDLRWISGKAWDVQRAVVVAVETGTPIAIERELAYAGAVVQGSGGLERRGCHLAAQGCGEARCEREGHKSYRAKRRGLHAFVSLRFEEAYFHPGAGGLRSRYWEGEEVEQRVHATKPARPASRQTLCCGAVDVQ